MDKAKPLIILQVLHKLNIHDNSTYHAVMDKAKTLIILQALYKLSLHHNCTHNPQIVNFMNKISLDPFSFQQMLPKYVQRIEWFPTWPLAPPASESLS
jgi:hypothetical protein